MACAAVAQMKFPVVATAVKGRVSVSGCTIDPKPAQKTVPMAENVKISARLLRRGGFVYDCDSYLVMGHKLT